MRRTPDSISPEMSRPRTSLGSSRAGMPVSASSTSTYSRRAAMSTSARESRIQASGFLAVRLMWTAKPAAAICSDTDSRMIARFNKGAFP